MESIMKDCGDDGGDEQIASVTTIFAERLARADGSMVAHNHHDTAFPQVLRGVRLPDRTADHSPPHA
jgi:hypothetical protein